MELLLNGPWGPVDVAGQVVQVAVGPVYPGIALHDLVVGRRALVVDDSPAHLHIQPIGPGVRAEEQRNARVITEPLLGLVGLLVGHSDPIVHHMGDVAPIQFMGELEQRHGRPLGEGNHFIVRLVDGLNLVTEHLDLGAVCVGDQLGVPAGQFLAHLVVSDRQRSRGVAYVALSHKVWAGVLAFDRVFLHQLVKSTDEPAVLCGEFHGLVDDLDPLEVLLDPRIGLARALGAVTHPVPDLLQAYFIPGVLGGEEPLPGVPVLEPLVLDVRDVSALELRFCPQGVGLTVPPPQLEDVAVPEGVMVDHRGAHRPHDGMGTRADNPFQGQPCQGGLPLPIEKSLGLVEDEDDVLSRYPGDDLLLVESGLVWVVDEDLDIRIFQSLPSFGGGAVVDNNIQGGG